MLNAYKKEIKKIQEDLKDYLYQVKDKLDILTSIGGRSRTVGGFKVERFKAEKTTTE